MLEVNLRKVSHRVCVREWFNCSLAYLLSLCVSIERACGGYARAWPVLCLLACLFPSFLCSLACGFFLSPVDYESYPILTNSRRPYGSIFSVLTGLSALLLTKIVNVYGPSNKIKRKMKKIFALQPASFLEK